jgi:hypothetical protein
LILSERVVLYLGNGKNVIIWNPVNEEEGNGRINLSIYFPHIWGNKKSQISVGKPHGNN